MTNASRAWTKRPLRTLAAALLMVSGLGAGVVHAQDRPMGPGGAMHERMQGQGRMHGHFGGDMAGLHERMLDRVKATPAQRTEIRKIHEAARADLKAERSAGQDLHKRARELFMAPTLDDKALEQVRQQMLVHHEKVSSRMWQARIDSAKVLTPEQRKELGERAGKRAEMMRRHQRERAELEGAPRERR